MGRNCTGLIYAQLSVEDCQLIIEVSCTCPGSHKVAAHKD